MRWLWLKRTDPNRPWSSLPETPGKMVQAMFNVSFTVVVGDGLHSYFWTDKWLNGQSITELAPALINSVRARARKVRTVADGLLNNSWAMDITGALTVQVIMDYLFIWDTIRQWQQQRNTNTPDVFRWKWTADGNFSTASAYRAFFLGQETIPGAKQLTKTRAPGRCKFFLWLAIHDRCWTNERRKRHNLQDVDSCTFCDQHSETINHLLTGCVFAREVWHMVLTKCNLLRLAPSLQNSEFTLWWLRSRKRMRKASRKSFDSLVILVAWTLWKERNQRVFQRANLSGPELCSLIMDEIRVWGYAGIADFHILFPFLPQINVPGAVSTLGRTWNAL